MPLVQILAPRASDRDRIETRFGKFQPGSYGSASYLLSFTETNFQVICDINSMPRIGSLSPSLHQIQKVSFLSIHDLK